MSSAARGLRQSVERSGGAMRISEAALGDAFGRGRMTPRARTALTAALGKEGLVAEPALTRGGDDGWVTLRLADAPSIAPPRYVPPPPAPGADGDQDRDEVRAPAPPPAAIAPAPEPALAGAEPPPPGMLAGAVAAGTLGTVAGLLLAPVAGLVLAVIALGVVSLVRARGAGLARDLAPRVPGALRAPAVLGALAFAAPAVLVAAVATSVDERDPTPPARTAGAQDPGARLLAQAERAFRAGDFRTAVRLTQQADPARLPALRTRIATTLVEQARAANEQGAHVRAIQLVRRAQRTARAPGGAEVVREARAGLDRRRAEERARAVPAEDEAPAAPDAEPAPDAAPADPEADGDLSTP